MFFIDNIIVFRLQNLTELENASLRLVKQQEKLKRFFLIVWYLFTTNVVYLYHILTTKNRHEKVT